MKMTFDTKLYDLSHKIHQKYGVSLYVVGGLVRNFILSNGFFGDIDISAPLLSYNFVEVAKESGFTILAEYDRTGTVKVRANGIDYEFTSFRSDNYLEGGSHTPESAIFTSDIVLDAKRRDFKCNAIYYDILKEEYVDPLGGIADTKNKTLDTVISGEEVFSHDGLRLMRLCRFAGELSFMPTKTAMESAKNNAKNIDDISKERVFDELKKILFSDKVYPFSKKDGQVLGIKMLDEIGVLRRIIPELFKRDVIEKTLDLLQVVSEKLRIYALFILSSNPQGALKRLKAPTKVIDKMGKYLLGLKGIENLDTNDEKAVRKFVFTFWDEIDDLSEFYLQLFSGNEKKIEKIIKLREKMQSDGTPKSVKDLKITSKDLMEMGISGKILGLTLKCLLEVSIENPKINEKETLKKIAKANKSEDIDN